MNINTYISSRKPSAAQLALWLNEAHQWHRIADDRRLSQAKLDQARAYVEQLIEKILAANPQHGAALRLKIRSEKAAGRFRTALRTLQELARREPYSADVWFSQGEMAIRCQQPETAEKAFNQVLSLQADRADAFCGIAQARMLSGDMVGAYLRAMSLYEKGFRSANLYQVIERSAPHLKNDQYSESSEKQLVSLLQDSQLNPECLSSLVATLLRHKFDLDNPEATIDIAACATDSLLINGLLLTTLPDETVEGLVTLLRQHLFLSACASGELEEGLQTLIMAIAVYAQRNDYIGEVSQDEDNIIGSLTDHINASLDENGPLENLVGALLLISMYRPLYTEPYSFRLLRWDLEEWPARTQGVFKLNLYDYANEHALRHEFCQTPAARQSELLTTQGKTAFPKWSLPELVEEWRDLEGGLPQIERMHEPHILVLGCGSGKRAIALAQYYPQATVLAIDDNAYDLAYAARQAGEIGCDNIEFSFGDWKQQLPQGDYQFDLVECSAYLTQSPSPAWFARLRSLCHKESILRLVDQRLTLSSAASTAAVPLPSLAARLAWRQKMLSESSPDRGSAARNALFNREGLRRMTISSASSSFDLGGQLEAIGMTCETHRLASRIPESKQRERVLAS